MCVADESITSKILALMFFIGVSFLYFSSSSCSDLVLVYWCFLFGLSFYWIFSPTGCPDPDH